MGTVRKIITGAALLAASAAGAQPSVGPHDPELPRNFTFALADICLPMTAGRVSLVAPSDATRALHIAPVATPASLAQSYGHMAQWFSPESSHSIFVGQRTDRPVCRLILADSLQTVDVQAFLAAALPTMGFARLGEPAGTPDGGHNQALWARRDGDHYVVLLVEAPRAPVAAGAGDQLMVAASPYSVAEFEARTTRRQ